MALAREPGAPVPSADGSGGAARAAWEAAVQLAEVDAGRLADELHNGLMQSLVVIRHAVARRPAGGSAEGLPDADDAVREALAETRRTVWHLRPRVTSDIGVGAALDDLAARLRADADFDLAHDASRVPADLSVARAVVVYRAVQELALAVVAVGASRLVVDVTDDADGTLVLRHEGSAEVDAALAQSSWRARGAALGVRVEGAA